MGRFMGESDFMQESIFLHRCRDGAKFQISPWEIVPKESYSIHQDSRTITAVAAHQSCFPAFQVRGSDSNQ
jgi:hypothetical protein